MCKLVLKLPRTSDPFRPLVSKSPCVNNKTIFLYSLVSDCMKRECVMHCSASHPSTRTPLIHSFSERIQRKRLPTM